jgi:hypothetical protein
MECWNIGMLIQKRSFSSSIITNFHVKKNFASKPMSHFTKTHYSIIPVFQHSNCERSELSSSSHPGRSKPGVWDFNLDTLRELEMMGCTVIKQTHVLSGLERSFSRKFSGVSHSEVLAECLRTLFGTGMKVAIECVVMAADGGAIPIEKTISVGGTSAQGRGADCAIVTLPAHASNFFDLRVLEILAKPFRRD